MALTNGRGVNSNSGPLIFLTPRKKDKDGKKCKPHFTVDRKDEAGEFIRDAETIQSIEGDLFRVEVRETEYNGEPSIEGVYYLRDDRANDGQGEAYRVGIRFGVAGCGLVNRLASLTEGGDFTGLKIDYYENKKGYDAYGLEKDGQRVEWRYSMDEQPKPEPIMHKGKLVKNDYSARNEFYKAELLAIAAALGQRAAAPHAADPAADQGQVDESQVEQEAQAQNPAPAPRAPAPAARPAPRPAPAAAAPAPRPAAAPAPAARPAARTTAPAPAARPAPAPAPAARPAARPAPKAPAPAPAAVSDAPGDQGDDSVPF
jgi:hypothetical protein